MAKYAIERCYVSIMLACKYNNTTVKHCVSKIIGNAEEYVSDRAVAYWLTKAIEEFRKYDKGLARLTVLDYIEYIGKEEFLKERKYDNEYQKVISWYSFNLKMLKVREKDKNENYIDLYPYL